MTAMSVVSHISDSTIQLQWKRLWVWETKNCLEILSTSENLIWNLWIAWGKPTRTRKRVHWAETEEKMWRKVKTTFEKKTTVKRLHNQRCEFQNKVISFEQFSVFNFMHNPFNVSRSIHPHHLSLPSIITTATHTIPECSLCILFFRVVPHIHILIKSGCLPLSLRDSYGHATS